MEKDNRELLNVLNESIKELQQGINVHYCLVKSMLVGRVDCVNELPVLKICTRNRREELLKGALKETIEVLEESRKAFKSKQLESLRKKLMRLLIDLNN
ncbi:MAG: hypothetical protein JW944_11415 [Deltaproteobacteria bacterium]|nr:hypothetical protein [Deltaproteobacteria bacterium]